MTWLSDGGRVFGFNSHWSPSTRNKYFSVAMGVRAENPGGVLSSPDAPGAPLPTRRQLNFSIGCVGWL